MYRKRKKGELNEFTVEHSESDFAPETHEMVRKQETKKKLKPKTVKVTSKAKPRKYARKNSINSSSISISSTSLNYTLPEGNHLDSFDQFLVDGKR